MIEEIIDRIVFSFVSAYITYCKCLAYKIELLDIIIVGNKVVISCMLYVRRIRTPDPDRTAG